VNAGPAAASQGIDQLGVFSTEHRKRAALRFVTRLESDMSSEHQPAGDRSMTADVATLFENMNDLILEVRREGDAQAEAWKGEIDRGGFAHSALNLAHYRPCAVVICVHCSVR
jgi:hypothetical protein